MSHCNIKVKRTIGAAGRLRPRLPPYIDWSETEIPHAIPWEAPIQLLSCCIWMTVQTRQARFLNNDPPVCGRCTTNNVHTRCKHTQTLTLSLFLLFGAAHLANKSNANLITSRHWDIILIHGQGRGGVCVQIQQRQDKVHQTVVAETFDRTCFQNRVVFQRKRGNLEHHEHWITKEQRRGVTWKMNAWKMRSWQSVNY